jgi:transcriptional regulator with XRE-family HTH domain
MGTFGSKLGHLMLDAGLNRVSLAKKMGVSKQTVGRWCNGESYPDLLQVKRMTAIFGGISIDWWVEDSASYPPATKGMGGADISGGNPRGDDPTQGTPDAERPGRVGRKR